MTEILEGVYTRSQLYWEICRYSQTYGREMSERTFRRWRQTIGIVPDRLGLYWRSDLDVLQDTVRRLCQGQTLNQIADFYHYQERIK